MAFSILTAPDAYALTKAGRMVYTFSGNARTVTAGAKAVNEIAFATCGEGTQFTLSWNGRTYTYTAHISPEQDGGFPTGNGSAAYVDKVMAFLKGRYEIREDFTLTRSAVGGLQTIRFTAKTADPNFSVVPFTSLNAALGTGVSVINAVPGVAGVVRTPYQVYVEVWLESVDGTHFDRITQLTAEADAAGLASVDVGNILHDQFSVDWPSTSVTRTNLNPHSGRRYYIGYGEAYGFPLELGAITNTDPAWAYLGGADYINRAGAGFSLIDFVKTIAAPTDWALRFGPTTRFVLPQEPQFLTFLNTRAAIANITLEVLLTYSDGSTVIKTDVLPATGWPVGSKLTLPVGASQLGLPLQAGSLTVTEYSVRLRQAGTNNYFSASYRYILNYAYQPYARFIAFESSLGCIDTVAVFGKGSAELTRFFEQAETAVVNGYNLTDGQFVDYDVTIQQTLDLTTGYRSEGELQRWNDLYRSPKRVLLVGDTALPVSIASKSIKQAKDGDNQFAHAFQLVYAFKDAFWTGEQGHLVGDPTPPPGFAPAGTVLLNPPAVITPIRDPTITSAVRELTDADVTDFKRTSSYGNHADAGYLNQQAATGLYAPKALFDQLQALPDGAGPGLLTYDKKTGSFRQAAPDELAQIRTPDDTLSLGHFFLRTPAGMEPDEPFSVAVLGNNKELKGLAIDQLIARLDLPVAEKGEKGETGKTGADGRDGQLLLSGAVDPALLGGTVGRYRDLFLNTGTGDLFQRVNDLANSVPGTWVLIANLRGPRGLPGPPGPPGSGGSGTGSLNYMPVPTGVGASGLLGYFEEFPQPEAGHESYVVTWQTISDFASVLFPALDYIVSVYLPDKVDKIVGKGLSTNDYTTGEQQKLAGLQNYVLPPAKATTLGGVKVGSGIKLGTDGTISVDPVAGPAGPAGAVESYSGLLISGVMQYAPILSLPASAPNTYDHSQLTIGLSGWTAAQKKVFRLWVSNRDSFRAGLVCEGETGANDNKIVAYRAADGSVRIFMAVVGFAQFSVQYTSLVQGTQLVAAGVGFSFSTVEPSGTLVYDSAVNRPDLTIAPSGISTHTLPVSANPDNVMIQDASGAFQTSSLSKLAEKLKPILAGTSVDPNQPALSVSVASYDPATGILIAQPGGLGTDKAEYSIGGLRDWSASPSFTIPDNQRDGSKEFVILIRAGSRTAQVPFTPYLAPSNWPGEVVISEDVNSHGVVLTTEGLNAPQGITASVARADGVIESGTAYGETWRSAVARPMRPTTDAKYKLDLNFFPGAGGPGLTPGSAYVYTLTNVQTGAKKYYSRTFPAGGNTNRVTLSPLTDTTTPTTTTPTTTPGMATGTLFSAPGRTPARVRQRVRVYENGGKKADIELLPATGWRYKNVNSSGDYNNQTFPDWETMAWADFPASGVATIPGAGNPNDNFTIIRIGRAQTPDEVYDVIIRMVDNYDWTEFANAKTVMPLAGWRILNKTNTDRLNVVWDRYENGVAIFKDVSGYSRGANQHFWTIGGKHDKIANNAPMGELRLAPGIITMIHRAEVLPGVARETGLQHVQNGTTAIIENDVVILYTGKP